MLSKPLLRLSESQTLYLYCAHTLHDCATLPVSSASHSSPLDAKDTSVATEMG